MALQFCQLLGQSLSELHAQRSGVAAASQIHPG
jgi:hypothetical protein